MRITIDIDTDGGEQPSVALARDAAPGLRDSVGPSGIAAVDTGPPALPTDADGSGAAGGSPAGSEVGGAESAVGATDAGPPAGAVLLQSDQTGNLDEAAATDAGPPAFPEDAEPPGSPTTTGAVASEVPGAVDAGAAPDDPT